MRHRPRARRSMVERRLTSGCKAPLCSARLRATALNFGGCRGCPDAGDVQGMWLSLRAPHPEDHGARPGRGTLRSVRRASGAMEREPYSLFRSTEAGNPQTQDGFPRLAGMPQTEALPHNVIAHSSSSRCKKLAHTPTRPADLRCPFSTSFTKVSGWGRRRCRRNAKNKPSHARSPTCWGGLVAAERYPNHNA